MISGPYSAKRRMRESKVEKHLVDRVKALGGVAEKYKSPGRRNVPDRIVLWPALQNMARMNVSGPYVHFVECKRPGEEPTPGQLRDHERRRTMGFTVVVVDSIESVDNYLRACRP